MIGGSVSNEFPPLCQAAGLQADNECVTWSYSSVWSVVKWIKNELAQVQPSIRLRLISLNTLKLNRLDNSWTICTANI